MFTPQQCAHVITLAGYIAAAETTPYSMMMDLTDGMILCIRRLRNYLLEALPARACN